MNSTQLQEKFPEVYKEFFSRNDLVVSGCFSMSWGNEGVLRQSQYLAIGSKIPLKCYIGIRKRSDNKVVFGDITSFSLNYSKIDIFQYGKVVNEFQKICIKIENLLIENNINSGIEINILTEIPRGHSFGFSDTSSAIIAAALLVFCRKIPVNIFDSSSEFITSTYYCDIKNLAWELSFIARRGDTIGQHILYLLSNSHLPICVFSQFFNKTHNIITDGIKVYQKELYLQSSTSELPIDYGIIYTGISSSIDQVEDSRRGDFMEFNKYDDFIRNFLGLGETNSFLDQFCESGNIINTYEKITSFLSIKTAYFLKMIIETGIHDQTLSNFIVHMNNIRKFISVISHENHFVELLYSIFHGKKRLEIEEIALVPSSSIKMGGGILFVMKHGVSRETLDESLSEIQKFYPNAAFDYVSYQDGNSNQGVVIEQFISENVFSKYIEKDHCIFKDNRGRTYINSKSNIIGNETEGLLIDLIDKKIYLNGSKFTSKEIFAQNSTSEILFILFNNVNKEIRSNVFLASSYSNNKNEMTGKIISPLIKVIKEKTNIDLPLYCRGGLTDFYLVLNDTNLQIGIINSIYP